MKARSSIQRTKAERARLRNERNLINHIDAKSKKAGKQATGEKAVSKKPVVPADAPKENSYTRLLRRIDEENERAQK